MSNKSYRRILESKFDLVCVENYRALQPDYVLIENMPLNIDEELLRIRNLYLARLDNRLENVAVRCKVPAGEGFLENFCTIIFDFKGSLTTKQQFIRYIIQLGLEVQT